MNVQRPLSPKFPLLSAAAAAAALALMVPAVSLAQDTAAPATPPPAPAADAAATPAPAPGADSAAAAPGAAEEPKPAHYAEKKQTANFDVLAVEPENRILVMREDGETEPQTYQVSKDIQNLHKVKPGDRVKVESIESVGIRIIPPGEVVKESDDIAEIARSKPDEQLKGVASRKRMKTATVSSVFPGSKEFMTRDTKGKLSTWTVKDGKDLETLKSGDRVQLTYTTALAASVTPAPPKPTTTTGPAAGTAAGTPAPGAAQPAASEQPAQPAPAPAPAEPAPAPAPTPP